MERLRARLIAHYEKGQKIIFSIQPALRGPSTLRVVVFFFALASLSHLWLLDAAQPDWYLANAIYLLGLVALCWPRRVGNALGWLLCALGLSIPLLFHRDALTQSVILLFFSATAGGALLISGVVVATKSAAQYDPNQHGFGQHILTQGVAHTPHRRAIWLILRVFQGITICTYLLAALHKLNRAFFAPEYSCATYGVDELFAYWNLSLTILPEAWRTLAPWMVLAGEGGIALLYLMGKRRWAWPFAIAFHIPLTLTMAPAFAFVMLVGHAAFLRPDDLAHLCCTLARYRVPIFVGASALTLASLGMHAALPEWSMIPKEWLLWALLILSLTALFTRSETPSIEAPETTKTEPPGRALIGVAAGILGLFLLNGLTPYLGVQYQHTGAMVSGLRIDKGCWNSLVFPESLRLRDDYIRVDRVYFRAPGHLPEYEDKVRTKLWSPPQIRQMRRNWCRPDLRPIHLGGRFRERTFVIEDLCDGAPLPFADAGVFGVELFDDYLRFQKNLERACPQSCIH